MPGTDEHRELRDRQTYLIIGAAMAVHRNLGSGFLEAVCQRALGIEFRERGISYEQEQEIPVFYRGARIGIGYRADFVCFGDILVELKGLPRLTLANFGGPSLQVKRFVGRNYSLSNTSSE